MRPSKKSGNGIAAAAMLEAGVMAIGIIAAVYFMAQPGREVPPSGPASEAVAPRAQTTPDLKGDTRSLQQPAPPDAVGSTPK